MGLVRSTLDFAQVLSDVESPISDLTLTITALYLQDAPRTVKPPSKCSRGQIHVSAQACDFSPYFSTHCHIVGP
jgi:hypothetical protein